MIKLNEKDFLRKMKDAIPMSRSDIDRLVTLSIASNVSEENAIGHRNLIIVFEELAELQQEISKWLRGKGNFNHMVEEIADVQLGIYYVQQIVGIQDETIQQAMAVKMDRLQTEIQKKGHYD